MEVSKEAKPSNVITSILQDDPSSPPESLTGAFVKTATAITSRAASLLSHKDDGTETGSSEPGDCLVDPWPTAKGRSDTLTGLIPEKEPPGPCGVEKGSGVEAVGGGDDVAVPEVGGGRDEVVVGGVEVGEKGGGGACVDGLQGVEVGGKGRESGGDNGDGGEKEQGILVEGLV